MNGAIYTYEYTGGQSANPTNGAIYTYEFTGGKVATPAGGAVFAYEFIGGRYTVPDGGAVFAYENTVANPNPAKWQFWDGTQFVRAYSYVWNGTSWEQVGIP